MKKILFYMLAILFLPIYPFLKFALKKMGIIEKVAIKDDMVVILSSPSGKKENT